MFCLITSLLMFHKSQSFNNVMHLHFPQATPSVFASV